LGLVVHYSAKSATSGTDATQLAARLESRFDRAEMQTEADVPPGAIVRFYYPDDHATARAIGKTLAEMGYSWRIENFTNRPRPSGPRTVEVWLPIR
jgi:hypothetical protein